MKVGKHACPHCGSHDNRILADQVGQIGWCRDCHRTWEAAPTRPKSAGGAMGGEVLSPHESRRG